MSYPLPNETKKSTHKQKANQTNMEPIQKRRQGKSSYKQPLKPPLCSSCLQVEHTILRAPAGTDCHTPPFFAGNTYMAEECAPAMLGRSSDPGTQVPSSKEGDRITSISLAGHALTLKDYQKVSSLNRIFGQHHTPLR